MSPEPLLHDEPSCRAEPDRAREPAGFTMLEILIVVTIIGALMAIVANQSPARAGQPGRRSKRCWASTD